MPPDLSRREYRRAGFGGTDLPLRGKGFSLDELLPFQPDLPII